MKRSEKKLILLLILSIMLLFFINVIAKGKADKQGKKQNNVSSANSSEQPNNFDIVLAVIGNKKINVNDLLYRASFTVRPGNFKNKNTTLNNLILEKILAIEAEKSNTDLLQNPIFIGKLKGIKEQYMREKLFEVKADQKVVLDSNDVNQKYRTSVREYKTEFYVITNDSISGSIGETLKNNPGSADSIFMSLEKKINKKPMQDVKYLEANDENITEALFSSLLNKGEVVGPIKLSNGNNILMRINDWKDEILLSGEDQRIRWNKVAEKIHQAKAFQLWDEYMWDIMKDKKIEYNNEVLFKLTDLAYQHYVNKNAPADSLEFRIEEIPKLDDALDVKSPFFTIDGKVWTVDDFKKELISHPLVFRARFTDRNSYNKQFLYAVADMLRDHYLNKEAYNLHLDTLNDINKTISIWRDSFLAIDQEKKVLDFAIEKGLLKDEDNMAKLKYWESYLSDLQKRYSDSVKIDYKQFKKIKLNKIDFLGFRPGAPFPEMVPRFPILSSSEKMDYIKK